MSRGVATAVVALATLLSAGVAVLGGLSDHLEYPAATAALYSTVSLAFVVLGVVAARRRPGNRTGKLMIAVGFAFAVGGLSAADNAFLFTLGAALGPLAYAFIVALALGYPEGALRARIDRLLVAATLLIATVGSVAFLLVADPEELCPVTTPCPENLLDVTDDPRVSDAVQGAINALAVLLAAALVVRLAGRWRHASPALRRVLTPVYLTTAIAVVTIVVRIVVVDVSGGVSLAGWLLQLLSLLAIPAAFLYGILRSRLARGSVGELMLALDAGVPPREALARALDDPTLAIGYWVGEQERYVADDGSTFEVPAQDDVRAATPVEHDGRPIAVIVHDASLREEPELLEAVVGAAGLALRNQALQVEARAQYALLETLVDTAPSLFVQIDTDGQIRDLNAVAVAVSGADDPTELHGSMFWDVFIDPHERQDVIGRFEALRPTFDQGEYENGFTNRKGERRIVFWRAAPVVGPDGAVAWIVATGIDVTDRREQAAAREREREFLSAIANEAPSLLCLVDEHGVVAPHLTNTAFDRTLEHDPAVGGHVFWERFVLPEHADDVRRVIARVADSGLPSPDNDTTWIASSGRRFEISWSCTPLPRVDERRLFLISGVDVTLRKHRELELQRERDATTTVLQAIPSAVVVLDREGKIRDRDHDNPLAAVNRAFREALQWRDERLVHRSFLEFVADDDGRAREAIETAARGEPSGEVESDWIRADGSTLAFSWTATPVADVTGRRDGLVLVCGNDVTERRERELEISRRRAFVDAITEAIPSFLVGVNVDGTIREQGMNRAFGEAFGWTQEELAGRRFVGTVVPAGDQSAARALAQAARGTPHPEIESRWDTRDHDSRIVAWSAQPVTAIQGERLVLVTGADVTVRRLQEEELRASRARIVSAADEARRRLERNLHDGAQQRLVALSVTLNLAETRLADDPAAAASLLAAAREELAVALEELRDFARGIHPAILSDRGLVPALEALVARSPVPVELEVDVERLPAAVEAAAYFVVAESLTNVVRYADATCATVGLRTNGSGTLVVTVTDDGRGGVDPTRGSGLRGLSDRLSALDGVLAVESAPGAGTCVRAEIPVRRAT